MIAVDSSALMAIVLDEALADACARCLQDSDETIISAVTLAEVLIVGQSRGVAMQLRALIDNLDIKVVPVDETTAEQVTFVYSAWGKGRHKASLNIVDCFSYTIAKANNCPLLFVGNDFSQTDIESVL